MNDLTLQEFIIRRKQELLKQINAIKEELTHLESLENSEYVKQYSVHYSPYSSNRKKMTFQEMVVDVLTDHPAHGATANEILELIERKHMAHIMRSSLSPQLSRLKSKRILSLNNGIWSLTPFAMAESNRREVKRNSPRLIDLND